MDNGVLVTFHQFQQFLFKQLRVTIDSIFKSFVSFKSTVWKKKKKKNVDPGVKMADFSHKVSNKYWFYGSQLHKFFQFTEFKAKRVVLDFK